MLHLHIPGTTQRMRGATLVQGATLGEGVRDFLFDAFLYVADTSAPSSLPLTARARPPQGTESGCAPLTGGDTLLDTPCRGGWTPRTAPATGSPKSPGPPQAPPPRTPRGGIGGHGSTVWPF